MFWFDVNHFFVPNNISNSRPFNFALSCHFILFLEEQTFEKLDQKNKTNNLTIPKRLWWFCCRNFNPLEICFSRQTKYLARQNSGETILLIKENPFKEICWNISIPETPKSSFSCKYESSQPREAFLYSIPAKWDYAAVLTLIILLDTFPKSFFCFRQTLLPHGPISEETSLHQSVFFVSLFRECQIYWNVSSVKRHFKYLLDIWNPQRNSINLKQVLTLLLN